MFIKSWDLAAGMVMLHAFTPSVSAAALPYDAALSVRQNIANTVGSLDYFPNAKPFTFTYSTPAANDTNWIGIWPANGNLPANGEKGKGEDSALLWEYATESDGTLWIDPEDAEPGEYVAFFLAQDGYETLAEPVKISFTGAETKLHFPVQEMTAKNARIGEEWEVNIAGLLLGKGSSKTLKFEKIAGHDWVKVSEDGVLSGSPGPDCSAVASLDILATADNGSTTMLMVKVPVRRAAEKLVEDLSVMSYNLWAGGTNVRRHHEKQLRFILESNVDVIGVQEAASGDHVIRLGKALGWDYWQSNRSAGILSRYPIVEKYGEVEKVEVPVAEVFNSPGGGVRINLNGDAREKEELNFWSAHLHYTPYGPYDFCFDGNTTDEVLYNEAFSGRAGQMAAIVKRIQPQISSSNTILVGDTNAPSHLDWVNSLKEKNCGIGGGFPWPTSIIPTQAGLIDSYRVAHPDPTVVQGTTWSPLYPFNEGLTGKPEPQDRIDFIYGTKGLEVLSSEVLVVGYPKAVPDVRDNEWTSDHKAVLTRYRL